MTGLSKGSVIVNMTVYFSDTNLTAVPYDMTGLMDTNLDSWTSKNMNVTYVIMEGRCNHSITPGLTRLRNTFWVITLSSLISVTGAQ